LKLPPKPVIHEPQEAEFKTDPIKYCVCMDTMGQDREFTKEQKKFAIETIKKYKLQWEERESQRLRSDRNLRVTEKEKDSKEQEQFLQQQQEEEDREAENLNTSFPEDMLEEEKKNKLKMARWKFKLKQIVSGPYKDKLMVASRYNVIRFPRIYQSFFYFLGYKREDICEPLTNKLFWKKAKNLWNEDLLNKLDKYTPQGTKEGPYTLYQKINFIESNMTKTSEQDLTNYSFGLAKLFSFLKLTIEIRKEDVISRKEYREKKTKEREEAIQNSEKREQEKRTELQAKKEEKLKVK